VTVSGLLTKPWSFVTTSSNANVCWNMVRGAVKIGFTAVVLLRVTPGRLFESTGKSVFHSLGQYHHGHLNALSHQSTVWSSPSSAVDTSDPITETEFEFVLAAYMLPLSGIAGYSTWVYSGGQGICNLISV
jgi:hypothetical protein